MSGNIITRREFNVSRMAKEFPDINITKIANAQWELELEYPDTDWEEAVYYDTGKPVKKPGLTHYKNERKIKNIIKEVKATPAIMKKKSAPARNGGMQGKKARLQKDIQHNGYKRTDLR